MDINTATQVVKNFLPPDVKEIAITEYLEASKATDGTYRPYAAIAFLTLATTRQLVQADDVRWSYADKIPALMGLLAIQAGLDQNKTVPPGFSVAELRDAIQAYLSVQMMGKNYRPGVSFMVVGDRR